MSEYSPSEFELQRPDSDYYLKHRTTLMRALAQLQDIGLIRWNTETGTFEAIRTQLFDSAQVV